MRERLDLSPDVMIDIFYSPVLTLLATYSLPLTSVAQISKKFLDFFPCLHRVAQARLGYNRYQRYLLRKMIALLFHTLFIVTASNTNENRRIFINNYMQDNNDVRIIMLQDLLDSQAEKLKELEYYEHALQELILRMSMIREEIRVTETIIHVIKSEKADILKKFIRSKDDTRIIK